MLESINKKSSSSVFSKLKDTKTQKYENEKCLRFGEQKRSAPKGPSGPPLF